MIIINQDKSTIVNMEAVGMIQASAKSIVCLGDEFGCIRIAEYSTEEKACKVICMLQDAYKDARIVEVFRDESRIYNPIFQLPQDDEV